LIAMTLSPLSASISSTVKTVSYRMALPTFFVASVLVATCRVSSSYEGNLVAYLRKNIIHCLARRDVPFSKDPQQTKDLDLQERIRDASHVVLRAIASLNQRF
jgi:hypothetical protein